MDRHLAGYVVAYYSCFMIEKERLANQHLMATAKATRGRSDLAAQQEARNSRSPLRELLSGDPDVLELTREGAENFCNGRLSE